MGNFRDNKHFALWLTKTVLDHNHDWFAEEDLEHEFYRVAIMTQPTVHEAEMNSRMSYIVRASAIGEYLGYTLIPTPYGNLYLFSIDSTKSNRDDLGDAIIDFSEYLEYGTPIRKTDRAGVGTKGTRAINPIEGEFNVAYS